MALQAERVALGAQQMLVVAAMRGVAGGAALRECRLMMHGLLAQVGDVGVAAQADADRIGLGQAGLVAGVRAVAIGAVAHGAGMRHLGGVDQLGLVVVAGDAESLWRPSASARPCRLLPGAWQVSQLLPQRAMRELRHQLGRCGLVRIVALQAVGGGERLILVRLLQVRVLGIMAIQAERRSGLGEMEIGFRRRLGAGLVREWQVSQPMSSAAWRLPFSGTFMPVLWQLRQRFSFPRPTSGLRSWFLLSLACGSWQVRQSRTAGGCTVPLMSAAFLSAWQVMHRALASR